MTEPHPPAPPPQAVIMQMMQGPVVAKCVFAMAELGIPDTLARGPHTAAQVAEKHALHADALGRMMRALCAIGVFAMDEAGRFTNGPLGEVLRADVPGSVRDYVCYATSLPLYQVWDRVIDVLRTGEPATRDVFGVDAWEYGTKVDPEFGRRFDRAMTSMSVGTTHAFVHASDLGEVKTVVDVGGGQGYFLGSILASAGHLKGTLFDREAAVQTAGPVLERFGVADRTEVVAGSFFETVPEGRDLYLLKHILHDWSDEEATRILQACRRAVRSDSEMWLVEAVLPPGAAPHPARVFDLHMMVLLGGRERTEGQWRSLLDAGGFALHEVRPLMGPHSVIVARPA